MTPETREKLINSLKDIHGYSEIAVPEWLLYTLIGIFSVAILYFLYRFFSKKKKLAEKPFCESLIEKLQKLKLESDNKKFYLNYSELIRLYFDKRMNTALLDKTTDEIKSSLYEIKELSSPDARFLIDSLSRADLAKFAKKEFSAEQKLNDLNKAINILQEQETKFQTLLKNPAADSNLELDKAEATTEKELNK
jgi:hypothetical protein